MNRQSSYDEVSSSGLTDTAPICSGFCITSKAVALILSWTVFVGALYFIVIYAVLATLTLDSPLSDGDPSLPFVVLYSSIAVVFICYPISGYFADVHCGRFRTILASLCIFLLSLLIFLLCLLLSTFPPPSTSWSTFFRVILISCLFTTVVGLSGYGANFVQFGLDQLLDEPNYYQGLYVHWAKWCMDLLSLPIVFFDIYGLICSKASNFTYIISFSSTVALFLLILFTLLLISCWKHHWFYSEPGHQNPYKVVLKVLNFARKNKYPLQRSAFTYCDDERPSRLDFAKERFGGPFTTEQVEDVKTFLRILMVLLVIGPVLILDVPTSPVLMFFFGVHFGSSKYCSWSWIIVNSGLLRHITSVLFLPVYIWVLFSRLKNHIPSFFCRLECGIVLYILGSLSIFFIEVVGHAQYQENDTRCMSHITFNGTSGYLNLHWAVYIPSNLLIGIGPTLLTVTIFEFISAQSPHTMKGLLLGAYFAISGIYQFIGSVALVPFTSHNFWITEHHPSRAGCLFGYLLFLCLVALIGMILFIVAGKCYKYREREDRPYDQRFVIDFYTRYLNEAHEYGQSSDSDSD